MASRAVLDRCESSVTPGQPGSRALTSSLGESVQKMVGDPVPFTAVKERGTSVPQGHVYLKRQQLFPSGSSLFFQLDVEHMLITPQIRKVRELERRNNYK